MAKTSKHQQILKGHNPEYQNLTIEKLRSWENFKDLTDDQAQEIVETIIILADILVDVIRSGQATENGNKEVPVIEFTQKMAA